MPTLVTLLVLLLVVLAAASAGALSANPVLDVPVQVAEQPVKPPPATAGPGDAENPPEPQAVPGELLLGALVVLVVGALALLVRFVLRLRSRPGSGSRHVDQRHTDAPGSGIVHPEIRQLATWAEETRAALTSEGSTSDVVIRCWLELERRCADAGVVRVPSRTTSDFTAAAEASLGLPAQPLITLHRLYQRARFGGGTALAPLTPADRATAAASVEELADALRPRVSRADGRTP